MGKMIFRDKAGTCWPHEYDWRKQFATIDPADGYIPMDAGKVYGLARALDDALQSRAQGEAVHMTANTRI